MNKTVERSIAPFLKKGDTIGIVAPAGPVRDRDAFTAGIRLLQELGFQIRHRDDIFRADGYLAGSDQERLNELHELWRDSEVKALLAARGGYGCLRILAGLDLRLIADQPKMLIGFSDLSALLWAIYKKTGLAGYHGPMLSTLTTSDRPSFEAFADQLFGRSTEEIRPKKLEILRDGQARGHLLPGNLCTLVHLIGTPWEPEWQGAIAVFEDLAEAPYRIDRLLSHLKATSCLDRLAGLILGGFDQCGAPEAIWQRVLDLTQETAIPVWAEFPCGHGAANHILPVAAPVAMDSTKGRLLFLTSRG